MAKGSKKLIKNEDTITNIRGMVEWILESYDNLTQEDFKTLGTLNMTDTKLHDAIVEAISSTEADGNRISDSIEDIITAVVPIISSIPKLETASNIYKTYISCEGGSELFSSKVRILKSKNTSNNVKKGGLVGLLKASVNEEYIDDGDVTCNKTNITMEMESEEEKDNIDYMEIYGDIINLKDGAVDRYLELGGHDSDNDNSIVHLSAKDSVVKYVEAKLLLDTSKEILRCIGDDDFNTILNKFLTDNNEYGDKSVDLENEHLFADLHIKDLIYLDSNLLSDSDKNRLTSFTCEFADAIYNIVVDLINPIIADRNHCKKQIKDIREVIHTDQSDTAKKIKEYESEIIVLDNKLKNIVNNYNKLEFITKKIIADDYKELFKVISADARDKEVVLVIPDEYIMKSSEWYALQLADRNALRAEAASRGYVGIYPTEKS